MESAYTPPWRYVFKLGLGLIFLACIGVKGHAQEMPHAQRSVKLMGSAFIFKAIHPDRARCSKAIDLAIREVQRIEDLISSWQESSQTSAINQMAGEQAVQVDVELYLLIQRALKVSELTRGSFDLSYASADRIWKFDGSMTALPNAEAVAQSVARINHRNILLNPADTSVYLKEKGMKIGFGAIGKGYAANQAKAIMQSHGIKNGLVNAGGDLICWGKDIGGEDWHIGIVDPLDKSKMLAWLVINDLAVVTSGDYERFTLIDGKKYAHIIDPKTGYPIQGVSSVSIFCPNAELADALATAVFVMGPEEGIGLVEKLNGIEGLLVDDKGKLFPTKGLNLQYYAEKAPKKDPLKKIGLKNE